jgi:hypothetical protein
MRTVKDAALTATLILRRRLPSLYNSLKPGPLKMVSQAFRLSLPTPWIVGVCRGQRARDRREVRSSCHF